jgi:hypothetical protein
MGDNSLHDIHTLDKIPPEILCKFFESTYDPCRNNMLTTFRISQVCRRWQETALSFQILWSTVQLSTGSPAVHELCLSRAGNLPLSVVIKVVGDWASKDRIAENIRCFAKHCERMVSIDIEAPDTYRSLFENLDFAAPRLVQFSCTVRPELLGPVYRNPLPHRMFQSHMPLLRVLSLKGLPSDAAANFGNLVDIQLTIALGDRSGMALFELLRRSPLVERLEIGDYNIRNDQSDPSQPRIELPRLTKLQLSYASSRFILSRLYTPAITHFSVITPLEPYCEGPIHPFLPDDTSQLSITCRIKTLKFTTQYSSHFAMNCHGDYGLITPGYGRYKVVSETWKYICATSLTSLTMLTVDTYASVVSSAAMIRALYVNMPSLQDLRVLQSGCTVFVQALADNVDLCPNLESIRVGVDMESCEGTFVVGERVVRARGALGRTIMIGCYINKGREDVRRVWNALCDEHLVQRW